MQFSALNHLNVDFSSPRQDPLDLKTLAHAGVKEGYPSKNGNLSAVVFSSVKMVADRHRHAAYHNKHWQRAF